MSPRDPLPEHTPRSQLTAFLHRHLSISVENDAKRSLPCEILQTFLFVGNFCLHSCEKNFNRESHVVAS